MVGQIGGLQRAQASPRSEMAAVERAFTLVAGWQKKDGDAIRASLADLKATAGHNQTIYDQAAQALRDLSAREQTVQKAEAALKAAQTKFATESEAARSRDEQRNAKLSEGESSLKERMDAFQQEFMSRRAELDTRTSKILDRETMLAAAEASMQAREAEVLANETANAERTATLQAIVGEIKAFAAKAEKAI